MCCHPAHTLSLSPFTVHRLPLTDYAFRIRPCHPERSEGTPTIHRSPLTAPRSPITDYRLPFTAPASHSALCLPLTPRAMKHIFHSPQPARKKKSRPSRNSHSARARNPQSPKTKKSGPSPARFKPIHHSCARAPCCAHWGPTPHLPTPESAVSPQPKPTSPLRSNA